MDAGRNAEEVCQSGTGGEQSKSEQRPPAYKYKPRPPVPKKPPIAHVKPLSPVGHSTVQASRKEETKGKPRIPPPLPRVPPKGPVNTRNSPVVQQVNSNIPVPSREGKSANFQKSSGGSESGNKIDSVPATTVHSKSQGQAECVKNLSHDLSELNQELSPIRKVSSIDHHDEDVDAGDISYLPILDHHCREDFRDAAASDLRAACKQKPLISTKPIPRKRLSLLRRASMDSSGGESADSFCASPASPCHEKSCFVDKCCSTESAETAISRDKLDDDLANLKIENLSLKSLEETLLSMFRHQQDQETSKMLSDEKSDCSCALISDLTDESVSAQSKILPCDSSVDGLPQRPPRPKREYSKRLKGNVLSPGSRADESVVSDKTKRKICPPKPKRSGVPESVFRSVSDASAKFYVSRDGDGDKSTSYYLKRGHSQKEIDFSPVLPPFSSRNGTSAPRQKLLESDNTVVKDNSWSSYSCNEKTAVPEGTFDDGHSEEFTPPTSKLKLKYPPPAPLRWYKHGDKNSKSQNVDQCLEKGVCNKNDSSTSNQTVDHPLFALEVKESSAGSSSSSIDHDYHEITEGQQKIRSNDLDIKYFSSGLGNKDLSPPPELPPRNFADNPPIPPRRYRDSLTSQTTSDVLPLEFMYPDKNSKPSSQQTLLNETESPKHYVEMSGSSTQQLTHRLSSSSQISNQSDSESGSADVSQNHSLSSSRSESEVEEGGDEKTKTERKIFYIAEEIKNSERVFVGVLKLLNMDFRLAVSAETEKCGRSVVPNELLNRILDYLPQLQNFNEDLLHDLSERIEKWDEIKRVSDIFVKKGPFLKLYTSYIKNFENTLSLLDDTCKKYPALRTVIKSFEKNPRCANLALKHYMLKPIQRIPQYKLLLQDYLKHLSEDSPDYKDTITALNIVSEVADHANESMRQGDHVHKLLEIQRALIGQFEVIKPGRLLLKKGELQKLSRKEMQPRMFILFNDVLLYTTPVTGGYKLNNILWLAGMKVNKPTLEDFSNEFSIISVQRSFTVCASTPDERDEWIDVLTTAIEENALKRNTFDGGTHAQFLLDKDFVLGSKAPLWVPDARVTMCMLCTCEFTVTWRRHHCRACGRVVCGYCSNNKAPLRYLKYKVDRVCDECFEKLKTETELQEKNPKVMEAENPSDSSLSFSNLLARFQKIRRSGKGSQRSYIRRPAWLKEVHANDQGATMSGYLKMFKGKKWKRLWFVLKDKVLYTYKANEDMAAAESTPLLGYEVTRFTEMINDISASMSKNSMTSEVKATNWFEGIEPGLLFRLCHANTPPMTFRTDSTAATEKWVTVMREASVP